MEGRDAELQASREAGLLDFIASALPASHTSKPEACQVTIYLLRLLKIVLATPSNKCYFLVQNLLPPLIPMLATALENYIKMAASSNLPGATNIVSSKIATGNLEYISEIVDGFLWTIAAIVDHVSCNEYQLQMQDGLIELVIAYQIIHRLRDLFALYDRPQVEGSPFPLSILLGINLLTVLTSKFRGSYLIDWDSFPNDTTQVNKIGERNLSVTADNMPSLPTGDLPMELQESTKDGCPSIPVTNSQIPTSDRSLDVEHIASNATVQDVQDESPTALIEDKQRNRNGAITKQPAAFLLTAMSETGLVCLPSMLTAVLLQGNNRLSAEQVR